MCGCTSRRHHHHYHHRVIVVDLDIDICTINARAYILAIDVTLLYTERKNVDTLLRHRRRAIGFGSVTIAASISLTPVALYINIYTIRGGLSHSIRPFVVYHYTRILRFRPHRTRTYDPPENTCSSQGLEEKKKSSTLIKRILNTGEEARTEGGRSLKRERGGAFFGLLRLVQKTNQRFQSRA